MLYETYPALSVCRDDIEKAIEQMLHTYRQGGKLLQGDCHVVSAPFFLFSSLWV